VLSVGSVYAQTLPGSTATEDDTPLSALEDPTGKAMGRDMVS